MPYKDINERRECSKRNWKPWYEKNKEKRAEYFREYRKKNKVKLQAKWFVAYAIKTGVLVRQPCEVCGTTENVDAHHHKGYEKENWIEVEWLCKIHHREAHTK